MGTGQDRSRNTQAEVRRTQRRHHIFFHHERKCRSRLERSAKLNGVHAVVVSNLGGDARVYCSFCPAQLSVDGDPASDIGREGTDLSNLSPGTHKLAFKQGDDEHVVDFDTGPVATLTAFVATDLERRFFDRGRRSG